ncbi:hypothetical protein ACQ0QQ_13380 [Lysinibacillus sphaericus]
MNKKQLYVVAAGGLGGVLFSLLISDGNNYVYPVLRGVFGVGIVLLILSRYIRKKHNNVPDRDERIDAMISKFSNYLSLLTIGTIWVAVFVFDTLGYQSIDLDLINGFLLLMLFAFLIGLSIIRRK